MPAKLDRCVRQVLKKKIDEFKEKYSKEPSKGQRKKFESSAWAICTSVGKKEGWL